jgi:hypothetical protein
MDGHIVGLRLRLPDVSMVQRNRCAVNFYVGLHIPSQAVHFSRAFISVNVVRGRRKPVPSDEWIMDSGAFRELEQFGHYRHSPEVYATEINRLAAINSGLAAAVSQDWMCEAHILEKTGQSLSDHQRLTIERYDSLLPLVHGPYLMPVLQGYLLQSYLDHIDQYQDRLETGMYVGVGSVCKRNSNMREIEAILCAIKRKRPDLRLHGFGLKITALYSGVVRDCLHSADSMAWSFAARREGRDANDWHEAAAFVKRIETMPVQLGWQM